MAKRVERTRADHQVDERDGEAPQVGGCAGLGGAQAAEERGVEVVPGAGAEGGGVVDGEVGGGEEGGGEV